MRKDSFSSVLFLYWFHFNPLTLFTLLLKVGGVVRGSLVMRTLLFVLDCRLSCIFFYFQTISSAPRDVITFSVLVFVSSSVKAS